MLPILLLFSLASAPCEGPGVDPWLAGLHQRVTADDGLALFAARAYGEPTACEGGVTAEFDGLEFGRMTLTYPGGITLEVETFPPESSVVTLRAPLGFADADVIRGVLRDYVARIGLSVDWSTPTVTTEGADTVHTFHDPLPGLNASASLFLRDGGIVGVRVSMAP
ncbi:MAG: hypothetical protein AMXMBFR53_02180 [Gemmatimonadota bacterium]